MREGGTTMWFVLSLTIAALLFAGAYVARGHRGALAGAVLLVAAIVGAGAHGTLHRRAMTETRPAFGRSAISDTWCPLELAAGAAVLVLSLLGLRAWRARAGVTSR